MPPENRNGRPTGFDEPGRRRSAGARRVMFLAGAAVALGVVTYALSLAANSRNDNSTQPAPIAMAPVGKCVVSYTVWSDTGKNFKAALTVANRDTVPVADWKLWFIMPGGQVMSGNGKEKLFQRDAGVTVSSKDSLGPQQTKTMQLTGRYSETNAAPMVFKLDNQNCETFVSGKPGAPSQPVQQLTDGSTRLLPAPTASNPAPGISVDPGGVVVPVPIIKSAPPVGGGPTTKAGPTTAAAGPPPEAPPDDDPSTPPTSTPPTSTPPTILTPGLPVVVNGGCDPDADICPGF
jgi:hypothetical protein